MINLWAELCRRRLSKQKKGAKWQHIVPGCHYANMQYSKSKMFQLECELGLETNDRALQVRACQRFGINVRAIFLLPHISGLQLMQILHQVHCQTDLHFWPKANGQFVAHLISIYQRKQQEKNTQNTNDVNVNLMISNLQLKVTVDNKKTSKKQKKTETFFSKRS